MAKILATMVIIVNTVKVTLIMYYFIVKEMVQNKDKVSKFTNVKARDGQSMLMVWLKKFRHAVPCDLVSDQGNIALIHGVEFGGFRTNTGVINSEQDIAKYFTNDGNYTLISCHNAFHHDFENGGRQFKRDEKTSSPYPIFCMICLNRMYAISTRNLYKQFLTYLHDEDTAERYISMLEDSLPKIIKEEDLPEWVKAKLNNAA